MAAMSDSRGLPPELAIVPWTLLPTLLLILASLLPRLPIGSSYIFYSSLAHWLRLTTFGIFLASYYHALELLALPQPNKDLMAPYTLSAVLSIQCAAAWWFLFARESNPWNIRFLKDGVELGRLGTGMRVWRSVELWCCTRAVGWNIEIPHLPPKPSPSRPYFILQSLRKLLLHLLVMDIASTYIRWNPAVFASATIGMCEQGIIHRCLNVLAHMAYSVGIMSVQYLVIGMVCVASGVGDPRGWPDMFGNLGEVWSVRRFWGRFWHQTMRRVLSSGGKHLSHTVLHFTPGSRASSRTQLLAAFVISGVAHSVGDVVVLSSLADKKGLGWSNFGHSLPFFMVQAVGVMVEDEVLAWMKERTGLDLERGSEELDGPHHAEKDKTDASTARRHRLLHKAARLAGYVWTFAWLMWTWPLFLQWGLRAGTGRSLVLPFSIVERVMKVGESAVHMYAHQAHAVL